MGIQFSITVDDDRIEIAGGACVLALNRSTAVHRDYEAAANMAMATGFGRASDFIVSLSPLGDLVGTMAETLEDTPLELAIRRAEQKAADEDRTTDTALYERLMGQVDRGRMAGQAKATREKMGDSQSKVADTIGVDQSYISRMERGDPHMRDPMAVDIARRVISHYSSAANEKPLPTRFGNVLRAARKAKHLSTEALGEQMALSRNYILKIEKDPFTAGPRATVERIATFLGVQNVERFYREAKVAA